MNVPVDIQINNMYTCSSERVSLTATGIFFFIASGLAILNTNIIIQGGKNMWLLFIIVGVFTGSWYMLYLVAKEASRTIVEYEEQDIKDMEEYHKRLNRK